MAFETIKSELDAMEVSYEESTRGLTNAPELRIDVSELSSGKARQVEFVCTSNECIVSKDTDVWHIEEL